MIKKMCIATTLFGLILAGMTPLLAATPGQAALPNGPTPTSVGSAPILSPVHAKGPRSALPTLSSAESLSSDEVNLRVRVSEGTESAFITLWDQPLSASNTNPYIDQDFSDVAPANTYLADDFTNGSPWSIRTLYIPGEGFNGFTTLANATSLTWAIYADAGGLPAGYPGGGAAPVWTITLPPTDPQVVLSAGTLGMPSTTTLTLTTPVTLPVGTWWLIYYPTMAYSPYGQFGRQVADTTNGAQAQLINPGNYFGWGTTWTSIAVLGAAQHDLAFRLGGQVCNPPVPLWNQPISSVNTSAYLSQDLSDNPTFSSYLEDDFTNAEAWTIRSLYIPGEGWNGYTTLLNATSLTWAIYADAGGSPAGYPGGGASPIWTLTLPPTDPQVVITNGGLGLPSSTTLTLKTPTHLPPGTWWLLFYPTLPLSPGGQWGRNVSDSFNGAQATFINPGGGFGYGTSWLPMTAVWGAGMQADLAFRIDGHICGSTVTIDAPALGGATCDWPVTHGSQTGRLTRNGIASSCAVPKSCPGLVDSAARAYDAYSFSNLGCTDICVTATLNTACSGTNFLFMHAYLGSFDPANLCTNYLADLGSSPSGAPLSMTFTVPASAAFTLVVNEVTAGAGCPTGYTLSVDGLSCPLQPPPIVAAAGTCSGVTVYWADSPGATGYIVYRGATCGGTPGLTAIGFTSPFNDIYGIVAGTTYNYWVVAQNNCGISSISNCATAATLSPAALGDTMRVTRSGGNLVIKWTNVAGMTSYRVYQDTSPSGSFTTLTGTATSGTTGLTIAIPSQTIFYKVAAVNGCGAGPKVADGPDTELWVQEAR